MPHEAGARDLSRAGMPACAGARSALGRGITLLLSRLGWSVYLARHLRGQAAFPFADRVAIERAQGRRVRAMVAHAYRTVPYYRETMDRLGLRPETFHTVADLARLPVVERKVLQHDPELFVSRAVPDGGRLALRSGGSTGAPLHVYHDTAAIVQNAAHGERERCIITRLVGRRLGYRETLIVAPHSAAEVVQSYLRTHALLPRGAEVERQYLSVLDPPAQNARRIAEFAPDVIHSFGSYVGALFAYLRRAGTVGEAGAPFPLPKVVTYSSDVMSDALRRLITDEFGIPVIGTYQAVEAFKIGFECGEGTGVHLNTDLYPVRIVDADGREVAPGEVGEVVVSNLVNRATVLLNYRLGDQAALLPGVCACGRMLPRMTRPLGRSDDWLCQTDGGMMHGHSVRVIFTQEPHVLQYQVVQQAADHFAVAIVPAASGDRAAIARQVIAGMHARFGVAVRVDVTFVDDVPRTERGKVRPVISLVNGSAPAARIVQAETPA